jgi:deoxyadenosine/deoxycytidine kinase
MRGREYEKSITAEYLSGIQESYFTFFRQNPENRYLILEINDLDFVLRPEDYTKVTDVIFNEVIEPGLNLRIF